MFHYLFVFLCEFQCSQDNILQKVTPSKESNEYIIPDEVIATEDGSITDYVFKELCNIEFTVKFNKGSEIEIIGNYTFYKCKYLKEINLSLCFHLGIIGSNAFSYCTSLSTIVLPPNLTTIYKSFAYTAIHSIHFPKSFVNICEFYPFFKCDQLIEVTFDDDSDIDTLAYGFLGYTAIQSFRIPKNLLSINGQTFEMTNISEFTIEEGNKNFTTYNKSLYSADLTNLYIYIKTTTEYSFPEQLKIIKPYAFANNYGELIIPSHVTEFNKYAFHLFQGTKIVLQSSNIKLTENMFLAANHLKGFYIPEGVTSIPSGCFAECKSLYFLYLPYSLTSINSQAFRSTTIKCFFGNYEPFKNNLNEINQTAKTCLILTNQKTCSYNHFELIKSRLLFVIFIDIQL